MKKGSGGFFVLKTLPTPFSPEKPSRPLFYFTFHS
jgi:hypothetical protein